MLQIEATGDVATAPAMSSVETAPAAQALTVEIGLYGLFALVGLLLRFILLDAAPLAPFEAANSWVAWLAATATPVTDVQAAHSALFYSLQSMLFFVTGGSDWLARLIPALFGSALVLLPWLWRGWLGRVPALVLALLFAVDPWLVAFSRTADGAALAIFLAVFVMSALWQWHAAADVRIQLRWERCAAVSGGLLLTSGVQAWGFVPVVVLYFFLVARPGAANSSRLHLSSLIWFGVTFLLGAAGFGLRPEAIGAVSASLTAWLAQMNAPAGAANSLLWPYIRLLVDQPLVTIYGVIGLVVMWLRARSAATAWRTALFLTLWLAWAMLLLVLPGRSAFALPLLGLPLAMAAALLIGQLSRLPLGDVTPLELVILVGVAAVLLISGVVWLASLVDSPSYNTQLLLTSAILLGLIALIWGLFGFWAGWAPATKIAGYFFAIVLLLLTVRAGWQLNHVSALMQPNGFFGETTDPGVRLLVRDVETLSMLRRGDSTEAEVQVVTPGAPDPVLGWNLRDMRHLRWVKGPEVGEAAAAATDPAHQPIVITPPGFEQDPALSGYLGSDYGVRLRWDLGLLPSLPELAPDEGAPSEEALQIRAQQAWSQMDQPRLEWLLYRTVKTPPQVETVDLWVAP